MSPSSPERGELAEPLEPGVVLQQVADHQHPVRCRAPPPPPRSPSATDCASGFSTKQCLPAASTRSASSACVGTGVATTTASRPGSASRSSSVGGRARAGERRAPSARARPRSRRRAKQLGVGQPVEVAGEVGAPVAEADDAHADRRRSQPHQVRRLDAARDAAEVDHERRAARPRASRSSPGWAVTITAQSTPSSRRRAARASSNSRQLRDVVVVVDELRALLAQQAHDLSAGDSRRSPTPGL